MLRPERATPWPTVRRLVSSLTVLGALLLATLPGHTQQPERPLFGESFPNEQAAALLLGGGSPLHRVVAIEAAQSLQLWPSPPPPVIGEGRTPVGAGSLLLSGFSAGHAPVSGLTFVQLGDFADCWSIEDSLRVRAMDRVALAWARDDKALPDPTEQTRAAYEETFLLNDALLKSLRAPVTAFDRIARVNLSAHDLLTVPDRYRGQVVRLQGKLKRVRLLDVPLPYFEETKRPLYEVWILAQAAGSARQVCLLTPMLPKEFRVAEDYADSPNVAVVGYFFKRYRYPDGSGIPGHPDRVAPLIAGHLLPLIGSEDRARLGTAALLLAGSSGPASLERATLLGAGEEVGCWEFRDPTRVPALEREYLGGIRDRSGLPTDLENADEAGTREYLAYEDAVIKADRTPVATFLKAVRPDANYGNLFEDPLSYRGKVVRVEGRLRRVTRLEPTPLAREAGVKDLYQCWLLNDQHGKPNPAVLITPTLPPGITPTEEMKERVNVSFVGYFFKRYRYKAGDSVKPTDFRDCPMVIGHVVPPRPAAADGDSSGGWTSYLMPLFFGVICLSIVVVFFLTWGFRKADKRVRDRLDNATARYLVGTETVPATEGEPKSGQ